MLLHVRLASLFDTKPHEYLLRFVLGGLATAATGFIAKKFGPDYGGLFLAFPAIFCASVTLIEKHERARKARRGLSGAARGKDAAALDAMGASLGGIGLIAFGAAVWLLAARWHGVALGVAAGVWALASVTGWTIRQWY